MRAAGWTWGWSQVVVASGCDQRLGNAGVEGGGIAGKVGGALDLGMAAGGGRKRSPTRSSRTAVEALLAAARKKPLSTCNLASAAKAKEEAAKPSVCRSA